MIALAQTKFGSERIRWQQADGWTCLFPDDEFDAVVCEFGVMFFPDKRKGFQEALRVLRPGGHFLQPMGWVRSERATNVIAARLVGTFLVVIPFR